MRRRMPKALKIRHLIALVESFALFVFGRRFRHGFAMINSLKLSILQKLQLLFDLNEKRLDGKYVQICAEVA